MSPMVRQHRRERAHGMRVLRRIVHVQRGRRSGVYAMPRWKVLQRQLERLHALSVGDVRGQNGYWSLHPVSTRRVLPAGEYSLRFVHATSDTHQRRRRMPGLPQRHGVPARWRGSNMPPWHVRPRHRVHLAGPVYAVPSQPGVCGPCHGREMPTQHSLGSRLYEHATVRVRLRVRLHIHQIYPGKGHDTCRP